jgi:hypothetical protein
MPEIIDRRISFNAGELSPWLDPRIDLDKYRSGCRTLENMLPAIYGGAMRRPGTEYLGSTPGTDGIARLVPFVASVSTSYILEFTNLSLRIWTTGATPALVGAPRVVVTPYSAAELNALQFAQQNDVLFIAHPNHAPRELSRYSAEDWQLDNLQVFWPATQDENVSSATITVVPIVTSSETVPPAWVYGTSYPNGAASAAFPADGDLGQKVFWDGKYWALKAPSFNVAPGTGVLASRHWMETIWKDVYTTEETHATGQVVNLTASAGMFYATDVGSKWLVTQKREALTVEMSSPGVVGDVTSSIFIVGEWSAAITATTAGGNYAEDYLIQRSLDNISWETRNLLQSSTGDVQKLITGSESVPCFLRIKRKVEFGSLPSALKCKLQAGNPNSHAIYEITRYLSSTSVRALVYLPQYFNYAPSKYWSKPAWSASAGYPRAVTLHQGRLFFGGTALKPTTFWGSAVDGYQDFRVAAEDDTALAYTLNSDEASGIEWLVSQESLLIGTASGEWAFGTKAGETVEKLIRNTSYGSLPVQARTIADAIVFIQRSGRKIREFAWSFERDGYSSVDLSMLAEHVGDSLFAQIAIQRNPDPIIWVVTAAGELLSLTYERSQKVAAWARHTTDGTFDSVAIVPGAGEDDQVWVSVLRPGNGTIRFIERFKSGVGRTLKTGDLTTLVYSDSSKTSVSSGTGLVSGLAHLIGKSVSLLVDGKVHPPVTVGGGGTVLLAANAANYNKTVVAGLPYTSTLEPTYLETMDPNSVTLAGKKRLHRAVLEFWKSGAVEVSTDDGLTWKPVKFETGVNLMTGPLEMYLEGSSGRQVTAIFRQTSPLPFNLMGLLLRYNVEMG